MTAKKITPCHRLQAADSASGLPSCAPQPLPSPVSRRPPVASAASSATKVIHAPQPNLCITRRPPQGTPCSRSIAVASADRRHRGAQPRPGPQVRPLGRRRRAHHRARGGHAVVLPRSRARNHSGPGHLPGRRSGAEHHAVEGRTYPRRDLHEPAERPRQPCPPRGHGDVGRAHPRRVRPGVQQGEREQRARCLALRHRAR